MYNPTTIKKYKGQMIMLTYQSHKYNHELSGVITATTKKHVLFLVNNDKNSDELSLKYESIVGIKKPVKDGKLE
jgi:hypothetical protein